MSWLKRGRTLTPPHGPGNRFRLDPVAPAALGAVEQPVRPGEHAFKAFAWPVERDAEAMENLEREILAGLGWPDPYA